MLFPVALLSARLGWITFFKILIVFRSTGQGTIQSWGDGKTRSTNTHARDSSDCNAYLKREDHNNFWNYKLCDEYKSSLSTMDMVEI